MAPSYIYIFLATLTAVTGNLTLKSGMKAVGQFHLEKNAQLIGELIRIFLTPQIIIGLIFYVISMIFWLKVLSLEDVSRAMPIMTGINFVLLSFGAFLLLGEQFTLSKILGIAIIFIGVYVITNA